MTPDFAESLRFLRWMMPEGPWMMTAISVDKKFIESRSFSPDDEEAALAWLQKNSARNLYYSVNEPVAEARESKKLRKSDVRRVHFLHVDVDPRAPDASEQDKQEHTRREQERILGELSTYKVPPSAIVFSGGGYNALWRLDKPVHVAEGSPSVEESVRRALDTERRNWQFELDFSTPDHCRDVSRILRLPGTINRPNEEKLRKGRVPVLARIVHLGDETYELDEFAAVPLVSTDTRSPSPGGGRVDNLDSRRVESLDELRGVPEKTKVIIAQGFDPEDKSWDGDRSSMLFKVCCDLFRHDVPAEVVLGIITDSRWGISASVLDKGSGVHRYALRQISRAQEAARDADLFEMNERHAVIASFGGRCMVMTEFPDRDPEFTTPNTFRDARDNEKKVVTDAKGRPKTVGRASWWFDQARRRQYERVVFEPGLETPGDLNLWRGFTVLPLPGDRHARYLEHMFENVCRANQEHYDYLIKWMARVVQFPRTQSMTAPVLLGLRGTGKSVFTDFFKTLFGKHTYTARDVSELTGRFNAHLSNCLFVVAEEAFDLRDKRHESVLKEIITGRTISVEKKGVDRFQLKNYIHLIMTSNEEKVVPAGDSERRFFVIKMGNARKQDSSYFSKILADQEAGGVSHLLHHLLQVDLSSYDVTRVPATDELRDQQDHNLSPEIDWLMEKLETGVWLPSGTVPWQGPVPRAELHDDYVRHATRSNVPRPLSVRRFGVFLRQEMPELTLRQGGSGHAAVRPWTWLFPPLARCREHFLRRRGWASHEWVQPVALHSGSDDDTNKQSAFL